jgi:hypothetical protein
MDRRTFTAGLLSASGLAVTSTPASALARSDDSWKRTHSGVFFIGAMPWVRLFDGDRLTCWASVTQVDWSLGGAGRILMLRQEGRRRILGNNKELLHWLAQWIWHPATGEKPIEPQIEFEQSEVALQIDPASGLRATAGDIQIEIASPIDRRLIRRERYPLGEFFPTASWVRVVCEQARVVVGGKVIPGSPNRSTDSFGQYSTAQINIAEVWTT